jgi:hypothetical protein
LAAEITKAPEDVDGRVRPGQGDLWLRIEAERPERGWPDQVLGCPVHDFRRNRSGLARNVETPPVVMARLDPAIYAFATYCGSPPEGVDHRVKPGDDDF